MVDGAYGNNKYAPKKQRDWVDLLGIWIAAGTFIAAVGAAIAASLAAYFTYGQWDAATRTLEATVRPYVKINVLPDTFAVQNIPEAGGRERISVQFSIENTGKFPAPARIQYGLDWQSAGHQRTSSGTPQTTAALGARYLFPNQDSGHFRAFSNELNVGDLAELRADGFKNFWIAIWVGYGPFPNSASYETRICNFYRVTGPFEVLRLEGGEPCPDQQSNSAR